jgi:phage/plasmid-associated DNA primase
MGLQGTGKGKFVTTIGRLLGQHFLQLDSTERLLGNFNNHMKNAVLVFADESIWGGNRKDIGRLKAMISEATATIEPKGKDIITIRNYRHFIFSSNEDWPVALDKDDRRFFVLAVSAAHKEDYSYFKAIDKELSHGGYAALLYELQHEDISDFDARAIPNNIEAFNVKLASFSSDETYVFRALQVGCFDLGNQTPSCNWPDKTLTESIYLDYSLWCQKQGQRALDERFLGKTLKKLIPGIDKVRPWVNNGPRRQYYTFPSIEQARQDYQKLLKMGEVVWDY